MYDSVDARANDGDDVRVAIPMHPVIPAEPAGELSATDRFIVGKMPLAARVARRHARFGEEWDDLFQEACLGLVETVRELVPAEDGAVGPLVEEQAVRWMRRRIVVALARRATFVSYLPAHALRDWLRVQQARRALAATLGRVPDAAELAEALDLTLSQAAALAAVPPLTLALDDLVERENATGTPIPLAPAPEVEGGQPTAQQVRDAVEALPEPLRTIIASGFAIGVRRVAVRQLAHELHLSPRRIVELRRVGLELLRENLGA